MEKSKASIGDTEIRDLDDSDKGHPFRSPQKRSQSIRKRHAVFVLAAILLLLLVTAILTYVVYSFALFVSAHTGNTRVTDRGIASAILLTRDELGEGQIAGIAVGVFILLAFICASVWMFSSGVDDGNRVGNES